MEDKKIIEYVKRTYPESKNHPLEISGWDDNGVDVCCKHTIYREQCWDINYYVEWKEID